MLGGEMKEIENNPQAVTSKQQFEDDFAEQMRQWHNIVRYQGKYMEDDDEVIALKGQHLCYY